MHVTSKQLTYWLNLLLIFTLLGSLLPPAHLASAATIADRLIISDLDRRAANDFHRAKASFLANRGSVNGLKAVDNEAHLFERDTAAPRTFPLPFDFGREAQPSRSSPYPDSLRNTSDTEATNFTDPSSPSADQNFRPYQQAASSQFGIIAKSTFSNDTEGWDAVHTNDGPYHDPAGYIYARDDSPSPSWVWRAPSKFLGDVSAAYGHLLAFDRKITGTGSIDSDPANDVVLTGEALQLSLTFLILRKMSGPLKRFYYTNRLGGKRVGEETLPKQIC